MASRLTRRTATVITSAPDASRQATIVSGVPIYREGIGSGGRTLEGQHQSRSLRHEGGRAILVRLPQKRHRNRGQLGRIEADQVYPVVQGYELNDVIGLDLGDSRKHPGAPA